MSLINILLIIIWFIVIPFILGVLFESVFDKSRTAVMFSRCFLLGIVTLLTALQIPAVPMIYIGSSFSMLCYTFTVMVVVIIAVSLIINWRGLLLRVRCEVIRISDSIIKLEKEYKFLLCATIILIAFQTGLLVFRMHTDTDDSRFLAEALEAVEQNTMLRIHPITGEMLGDKLFYREMRKELTATYPFLISIISVLTRVHPTVLAHSVMPMFLIPLAYASIYLLGTYFFDKNNERVLYMFITSALVLFSFESRYSWGYTLLTIIWQGRSILAVGVLPFLWYVLLNVYSGNNSIGILGVAVITGIACACLSGMGTVIAPMVGGAFALSYLIKNKNIVMAIIIAMCMVPCGLYAILEIRL